MSQHSNRKRPHETDHNVPHRPNKFIKSQQRSGLQHGDGKERPAKHKPQPTLADFDRLHPSSTPYAPISAYPTGPPRTISITAVSYPPPLPALATHLADAPFTHASVASIRDGANNYERLEFLGDGYLELIATRLIYSRFQELPPGRMSMLRERLVKNVTLAGYARLYGFGERMKRGADEYEEKRWTKMLGDTVEAYVAAIVLSEGDQSVDGARGWEVGGGGFAVAEGWLTELWLPELMREDPNLVVVVNRKDELMRAVGGKFVRIQYREEGQMWHTAEKVQQFTVGVYLSGWGYEEVRLASAVGISIKEAGMKAAGEFLDGGSDLLTKLSEMKRANDEERREKARKEKEKEENDANDKQNGESTRNDT